jgi:hypothetical protein
LEVVARPDGKVSVFVTVCAIASPANNIAVMVATAFHIEKSPRRGIQVRLLTSDSCIILLSFLKLCAVEFTRPKGSHHASAPGDDSFFTRDESGATAIEYALIAAGIPSNQATTP